MSEPEQLKLYYQSWCVYSRKVLHFIERNNLPVDLCSTAEPDNQEYLITQGGKNQVPCLFIEGKPLYESGDIIAYLRKRFL